MTDIDLSENLGFIKRKRIGREGRMMREFLRKCSVISLACAMAVSMIIFDSPITLAEDVAVQSLDDEGYSTLGGVVSSSQSNNTVDLQIYTGEKIRFTFLENNVFRMYMAPEGEEFREYPSANNTAHTAKITAKTDSEYKAEYNVVPTLTEANGKLILATDKIKIEIDVATSKMKLMKEDGTVVWEESEPLKYKGDSTKQTLVTSANEYFYGGGTQNGRFSHKGTMIKIENTNNWVDGGVASPSPFYWSTNGYGVVRNTFKKGTYDFGFKNENSVVTTHTEKRFDAYYFVGDSASDLFKDYYELTGNPVELPEYASYLGHLNCYNRDFWKEVPEGTRNAVKIGTKYYVESQTDNGGVKETLVGSGDLTAQKIIEEHKDYDMPLGWFLPNDGYGCGYGQTPTQAGDIENLEDFATLAKSQGIETGLWTQSNLWPKDEANPQKNERDIYKEVEAGVTSVKTDVAWVGAGYSMALHGVSVAYDAIVSKSTAKPNIVTLDGWAGTQRYAGIWTGDQYGGDWEYIRFHIPTYIGTSLSGQPNVGSDMDGIFGGKNKIVNIRDFQWKAFTTYMLDMDGWGSNQKSPWALGEDGTSINRAYLKMKAQLMPYINTISYEATIQGGLPMIRAMFLEEQNEYTLGKSTQYQYMWGDHFLVAPIYQSTAADAEGNDLRNDIYIPSTSDIWVDYLTGEQYRGGQILNNFDAPIWKLPIFVKNGSIIPMYSENNNPAPRTAENPDGLDRSQRIVEFYPYGETSFTAYEDDGFTLNGGSITTQYTSKVEGDVATLSIQPSVGSYANMVRDRSTEFIVNVSKEPSAVKGNVAGSDVTFTKVTSLSEYENASGNVYFYDENPSIFVKKFASEGSSYETTDQTTTPKLYVKSTDKVNITANAFTVAISGFENNQDLGKDELNSTLAAPAGLSAQDKTSSTIKLAWDAVDTAETYDVLVDGVVYRNFKAPMYEHLDLHYSTEYTYQVRAVNKDGYSQWSSELKVVTEDDPYRNVPAIVPTWEYGDTWGALANAFDFNPGTYFHSKNAVSYEQSMLLDLSQSYQLDKFTYQPRMDNKGNGTVKRMDVYTSVDGVHFTKVWDGRENAAWTYSSSMEVDDIKTMNFPNGTIGRYIKLNVIESSGGFFSAAELIPYKVDGTSGVVVGDTNNSGSIDENDLTFFDNYTGLTKVDNDWGYVSPLGNIDGNDIIDAYDVSYVARMLGDKPVESTIADSLKGVEGKIQIIPSKTTILSGEEVTLEVYGFGLENVNAFSLELPVDDNFDVVNPGAKHLSTIGMRNFSKIRIHSDNTVHNYTLFTNVGKQELLNGTGVLAKITIKAKQDFVWDATATRAVVVGLDLTTKDAIVNADERPSVPPSEKRLKPQDGIASITYFNEVTNQAVTASDIWQPGYAEDKLFDGDEITVGGNAEFKWSYSGATWADEVYLPTQMIFELEDDKVIKEIVVSDRKSSNGRITKMKVEAFYRGEVVYVKQYEASQADPFVTEIPASVGLVDKVVITPQASLGTADSTHITDPEKRTNRMLTLQEIRIVSDEGVNVQSISMSEDNPTEIYIGKMAEVSAVVNPAGATDPFYTIVSSDESIAKVVKIATSSDYKYIVQGVSGGVVTLTATSMANPSISVTQELTVIDSLDRTDLEAELEKAMKIEEVLYTAESYAIVKVAITDGRKALVNATAQSDIDQAVMNLKVALAGLKEKGSDSERPKSENLIAQSELTVISASSQAGESPKENIIDGNSGTIWHSNYNGNHLLPQNVVVDLGANYYLEQVDYLTRQESRNGQITKYQLEISSDGENFVAIVKGTFDNDGQTLIAPDQAKEIKFEPQVARYVRFVAVGSLGATQNMYAAISEMNFYGKPVTPIGAERIYFEQERVDMVLGNIEPLHVVIEPVNATDTLTFTSSDETVVLVDHKGKVTTIGEGTATITVVANSLTREALTATIDVVVTNPTIESLQEEIDSTKAVLATENEAEDKVDELNAYLQEAIDSAQAVVENPEATEENRVEAFRKLQDGREILELKSPVNAMKGLVNIELRTYSQDSHDGYLAAKTKAEGVLVAIIANREIIQEVHLALTNGYNALVLLDSGRLSAIIEEAVLIDLNQYIDGAEKNEFKTALEGAQAKMSSAVNNSEYDGAFNNLETAMTKLAVLRRASTNQIKELEAGVAAMKQAVNKNKYSTANKKIINNMIERVETELASQNLTQLEAEQVIRELNDVLDTTVKDVIKNPDRPSGGGNVVVSTPSPTPTPEQEVNGNQSSSNKKVIVTSKTKEEPEDEEEETLEEIEDETEETVEPEPVEEKEVAEDSETIEEKEPAKTSGIGLPVIILIGAAVLVVGGVLGKLLLTAKK